MDFAVNAVKIDGLSSSRSAAGKCQAFLPGETVNQTGLADVTSSQKSNFRQSSVRKLIRGTGANQEFCL